MHTHSLSESQDRAKSKQAFTVAGSIALSTAWNAGFVRRGYRQIKSVDWVVVISWLACFLISVSAWFLVLSFLL